MEVFALSLKVKEEGMATVEKATASLRAKLKDLNLGSLLAGAGLAALTKSAIDTADQMRLLEGRLKLVTGSAAELTAVQDALRASANATRSDYASVVELYARVARSTQSLGLAQSDLLRFTELTNMAIKTSGATSVEASAALIQLSQGLASGTLRGDEFRSVMEQVPGLALQIANGLGVTVEQLRALAMDGKLTADAVIGAVLRMDATIRKEFATAPVTVADAFVVLRNAIGETIGEVNKATGATAGLAQGIAALAPVVQSVGAAFVAIAQHGADVVIVAKAIALGIAAAFAPALVAAINGLITRVRAYQAAQVQTIALLRTEASAAAVTARALVLKGASTRQVELAQLRAAVASRSLTAATSFLGVTLGAVTTAARAMWVAIGGPIGATILAVVALNAAFEKFLSNTLRAAEARDEEIKKSPEYVAALELQARRRKELAALDVNAGKSTDQLRERIANLTSRIGLLNDALAQNGLTLRQRAMITRQLDELTGQLAATNRTLAAEIANATTAQTKQNEALTQLAQVGALSAAELATLRGQEVALTAQLRSGNLTLDERVAKTKELQAVTDALAKADEIATSAARARADLDREIANRGATRIGTTVTGPIAATGAELALPPLKPLVDKFREQIIPIGYQIKQTMAESVGMGLQDGLTAGIAAAIGSGRIADAWQAMSQAIVQNIASAMVNVALAAIEFGTLMQKIQTFLVANPAVAVAAAAAMLAFAYANGGKAKSGKQAVTGGIGGASFTPTMAMGQNAPTQLIFGATSATTAAGMTPRQALNVTIIGPNDPTAQRAMQELMRNANQRGTLG